jgi:hypothetical protein
MCGKLDDERNDLNGLDGHYPPQTNPYCPPNTVLLWVGLQVGPD